MARSRRVLNGWGRRGTVLPWCAGGPRALFIMVLSFLVAMVGTIAVIDAEQPLVKTDGLWMMAFALLAVATAAAAVLSHNR